MKKQLLRILMFILATTMLVSTFTGCKKQEETPQTDSSDVSVSTNDTEVGDDVLGVPKELDYGGADITILAWEDAALTEFEVDGLNGSAIDEAIYFRNMKIEDELGIKLKYFYTKGNVSNIANYKSSAYNAMVAGRPYDILASYTRSIAQCAIDGMTMNLGSIDDSVNYLDTSKVWWNDMIVDKCSINDSFYFVTGDASTSFVQMIYCIYFNNDLIERSGLESPYELVANNEWTIDKMLTMTKDVFFDANGNTATDIDVDTVPFCGERWDWPSLLHGCGINYVKKDSNNAFVVDNIGDEKAINLMDDLTAAISSNHWYVTTDGSPTNAFKDQRLLFWNTFSGRAKASFTNVDFEYGCVPMPKYESSQEAYYCATRQPITLFAIQNGVSEDRLEMVTATLETYAYEGYKQTTPVIFHTVMSYQTSASSEMADMLALIKDSAYFDFGRIYVGDGLKIVDQPGYYLENGLNWANYVNGDLPTYKENLKKLSDSYASLAT